VTKRELIKRIIDRLALLGTGLLLSLIVTGLLIFGKVTIIENISAIKILDGICVIGILGYALYRIISLFKEIKE
jgi:Na+/H+ antiporter NhaA